MNSDTGSLGRATCTPGWARTGLGLVKSYFHGPSGLPPASYKFTKLQHKFVLPTSPPGSLLQNFSAPIARSPVLTSSTNLQQITLHPLVDTAFFSPHSICYLFPHIPADSTCTPSQSLFCYPDKSRSLLLIPDHHGQLGFFVLLFFQLGLLSLEYFGKKICKSHVSNNKQQLIDRLELYRSIKKDEMKEQEECFQHVKNAQVQMSQRTNRKPVLSSRFRS